MNTNKENIKSYLENNNVNPTYQRIVIMKYLRDKAGHPTAEQIYSDIVEEVPTISKTTVYNSLNVFTEAGIVQSLNTADKTTHYEFEQQEHDHFYCIKCGRIYDVDSKISSDQKKINSINGNKIDNVQCYYKGVCKHCLTSES